MLLLQELFTAIETGNVEEVELILESSRRQDPRHFDLNQRLRPMYEMTPLHLAVGLNSRPIVKYLLEFGADPNSLNCSESVSPLHLSILYELDTMVKILVEHGGDPKLLDGEKKSCFDLAVENDVAHLLEQLNLGQGQGQTYRSRNIVRETIYETTETETETETEDETETVRKSTVDPVSPTYYEAVSMLTTQQPPKIISPQTDVDSFYSCFSAAMRTARSENTLPSAEIIGTRKCTTSIPREPEPETGQSSASTSPTSSHDVWEPGYSFMLTEDDGTCCGTGTDDPATDADKSSSVDTTIVIAEEFEVPTEDEESEPEESDVSAFSIVSASSVASIPVSAPTPIQASTPKKKNLQKNKEEETNANAKPKAVKICSISSIAPEGPTVYATPKVTPTTSLLPRILRERNEIDTEKQESEKKAVVVPPSPANANATGCGFSLELQTALLNLDLIQIWGNLKIELIQTLTPTKRRTKSFYNYILLDPKVIRRANFSGNHLKHDIIKNPEKFERFLSAVFYVGKGCGNRPIAHLVDAKIKLMQLKRATGTTMGMANSSDKLTKILQIWKAGQGVMLHSVFHHSEEREANIYEAAMIDALGINCNSELTNVKKGSYLGTGAMEWTQKTKNQFGSFLLYKCFCSFVVSDAKVFFPHDV